MKILTKNHVLLHQRKRKINSSWTVGIDEDDVSDEPHAPPSKICKEVILARRVL